MILQSATTNTLKGSDFPIHRDNFHRLYMRLQSTDLALDTFHCTLYLVIMGMWHDDAKNRKESGYEHASVFTFYKPFICSTLKIGSNIFSSKMRFLESLGLWEYSSSGANLYTPCSVRFKNLAYEGFSPDLYLKELGALDIMPTEKEKKEKEKVNMDELLSDHMELTPDVELFVIEIIKHMRLIAIEKQISTDKKEKYANFKGGQNEIAAIKIYEKIKSSYPNESELDLREIMIHWLRDKYESFKSQNKVSYFNPCGIIYQMDLDDKKAQKKNQKSVIPSPKKSKKK